ncbi:MAG: class I SAM-dependent RNA methyltransferase [Elusimicrobiota bacterium]
MKAKCRHFKDCGGCSFQDVNYKRQLERKTKKLEKITGSSASRMIPSPEIYGFRNKMEYSFESGNLGLHPKGKYNEVVDLKECPVFSKWIGGFLEEIRKFAAQNRLSYYSRDAHRGLLRYLIVRESKFTGEKSVMLVVDGEAKNVQKFQECKSDFKEMAAEFFRSPAVIGISYRHSPGDTALSEDYEILTGKKYLNMKISPAEKFSIRLSPYSFFQPNSYQIENLYRPVRESVGEGQNILDLYTGLGSIPFYISGPGLNITGVESFPSCIEDAKYNRVRIQPEGNLKFIHSKVRQFLDASSEFYDTVVLDPPRGGVSYRVFNHINRLKKETGGPKKVIYICCSLKNLEKDFTHITENLGWEVTGITGIDQFVHTPHLEVVAEFNL